MEQSADQVQSVTNEALLCEIERYLKPLIEKCPKNRTMHLPQFPICTIGLLPIDRGKINVTGAVGETIIVRIKLLFNNINSPENLKEKIIQLEKTCKYCINFVETEDINYKNNLLFSFKEQAEDLVKYLKKSLKKFTKNTQLENMQKQIEELKSKNLVLEEKVANFEKDQKKLSTDNPRFFV